MSKSRNNVVTHGLSGMVGGMLVFKQVNGKTVVAQRPRKSSKEPDEGQLARQQKFKEAAIFAKAIIQDPLYKQLYEGLSGKGKSAYNIAFADYFKPPVLSKAVISNYQGQVGDKLKVQAVDEVKVESVKVTLIAQDQTIIETGEASLLPNGIDWEYTIQQSNTNLPGTKIIFEATDIPANSTTLEVELT